MVAIEDDVVIRIHGWIINIELLSHLSDLHGLPHQEKGRSNPDKTHITKVRENLNRHHFRLFTNSQKQTKYGKWGKFECTNGKSTLK